MSSLRNKVVLITGAAGGFGRAMAKMFADAGAKLSLTDIDDVGLGETVKECRRFSENCAIFTTKIDVRNKSQLETLSGDTITKYGQVDVLINNAGIGVGTTISDMTEEEYDRMMDVNLKAMFFLTKEILPELVKTKGSVINISSVASIGAIEQLIVYCMTKAAVDMFTKCVAKEYAPQGVRVNSINPGVSNTPLAGTEENPTFLRLSAPILQPLGGLIQPEEIARWAVFLASSDSGPITGQSVVVDSGKLVTGGVPSGYQLIKIE